MLSNKALYQALYRAFLISTLTKHELLAYSISQIISLVFSSLEDHDFAAPVVVHQLYRRLGILS